MQRLQISDDALWQQAKDCVERGVEFAVEIGPDHPQGQAFVRMLQAVQGYPDRRWIWRKVWDALRTADLFAIWNLAVNDNGYRWSWARYSHATVVTFSPPPR